MFAFHVDTSPVSKEGSSRNFHTKFIWVQSLQNVNSDWQTLQFLYLSLKMVLDKSTLPAQVMSQTCNMTQFLLQVIYKSIQIYNPLWKCVYPIENWVYTS